MDTPKDPPKMPGLPDAGPGSSHGEDRLARKKKREEEDEEEELDEDDEEVEEDEEEEEDEEYEEEEEEEEDLDEEDEEEEDEEEEEEEEEKEPAGQHRLAAPVLAAALSGPPGPAPPAETTAAAVSRPGVETATPEAKDAPADKEQPKPGASPASGTPSGRPRLKRPLAGARPPGERTADRSAKKAKDSATLKLVALGACLVLFVACVVVGGYAVYVKFVRKQPPPPGPTTTEINYGAVIEDRFKAAKTMAETAKQMDEAGNYEGALAKHQEAVKLFEDMRAVIEELRQKKEYSGPDYVTWDERADKMLVHIHNSRTQIFRLENILMRKKLEQEGKSSAPPTPTPPARTPAVTPAPAAKDSDYDPEYPDLFPKKEPAPAKAPAPPAPPTNEKE